jgi:hypothetical protein
MANQVERGGTILGISLGTIFAIILLVLLVKWIF